MEDTVHSVILRPPAAGRVDSSRCWRSALKWPPGSATSTMRKRIDG